MCGLHTAWYILHVFQVSYTFSAAVLAQNKQLVCEPQKIHKNTYCLTRFVHVPLHCYQIHMELAVAVVGQCCSWACSLTELWLPATHVPSMPLSEKKSKAKHVRK